MNATSTTSSNIKGFWSLFIAQVQGAFSDSVFKFMVVFLVTTLITNEVLNEQTALESTSVAVESELSPEIQEEIADKRDPLISTILVIFATPMLIFAMTAGYLADRYPKSTIVFATKSSEILIMCLATLALYFQSIPGMLAILFLMSVQSSFFSPPRLGMMTELVSPSQLSWANGMMGMGTFFSIIVGGLLAGLLTDSLGVDGAWQAGLLLVGLAVVGSIACSQLPKMEPANLDAKFQLNFLPQIWANIQLARRDRILFLAISGSVFFWFVAALFGEPTVLVYGKDLLQLNDSQIGLLKGSLAMGIAGGCILAGTLSAGKIEYGLIPVGAIGLSISAALLGIPGLSFSMVMLFLFLIGVSGGFFVVPINSIVQFRPDQKIKGAIIATERWLTAAGVLAASLAFYLLKTVLDLDPTQIFLVGAVGTVLVTLYTFWLMPEALARLVLWLLTHTFYRIRTVGRENLPDEGGALLVANHLSMADALFVIASNHRQIRFIMHRKMYRKWWIYPVARMLRAIPIASDMGPREMVSSLNEANRAVAEGQVVCIFAEGQIAHFGQMLPFRKGLNRILKGLDAPIIPIHLDNVWGSIFSFERGKFYFKIPRQIPYPITVSYGEKLEPATPPHLVRNEVVKLGAQAWNERKNRMPTITKALIQSARRNRFRHAFSDRDSRPITFMRAFRLSMELRNQLAKTCSGEKYIGVVLPPSVDASLVNWAILLADSVPINLDPSAATDCHQRLQEKCGIKSIIGNSEQAQEMAKDLGAAYFTVDGLVSGQSTMDSFVAGILANLCPQWLLRRKFKNTSARSLDDVATICMTRGRTGTPKWVRLSHYNLVSNVQQLNQVLDVTKYDRFATVVPVSHALGFNIAVVIPAVLGKPVHLQSDPADGAAIGKLVQANQVTTLLCTPETLAACVKGASPEQLGSLRTVLVGGSQLSVELENQFEDKFGLKPFEGYGCTECSPIVSVNTFDFRTTGKRQIGSKKGTVGMGLPGLALRVADPVNGHEVKTGESGELQVKGPNVMLGYLGETVPVDSPLIDGWFRTGDFALMDEEGFVHFDRNVE